MPWPRLTRSYVAELCRGLEANAGENNNGGGAYRLWVNDDRTVLVRMWEDDTVEVATRETPAHTWGPPVYLTPEPV